MKKRPIQRGRPTGATTDEAEPARAFADALRTEQDVAQETLPHLGEVERVEHMPTLALILKISRALECSSTDLVADTERCLGNIEP